MDRPKNTGSCSIVLLSRMERRFVYCWLYVGNRKADKVNVGDNNLNLVY